MVANTGNERILKGWVTAGSNICPSRDHCNRSVALKAILHEDYIKFLPVNQQIVLDVVTSKVN